MISISAVYFFHIADILENMGVSREGISAALNIDMAASPNPKSTFNLAQFDALLAHAGDVLSDDLIGLQVSEAFRISTFPGPTEALAFCHDIDEATKLSQRYSVLVHNLGFPHLEKSGDGALATAKFTWIPNYKITEANPYRQITEYVVSNYVQSLNWLAWGFGKGVKKVTFAHDGPGSSELFARSYGCDVAFGADEYAIYLNDGLINRPLPTADRAKLSLLQTKLEKVLASSNKENDLIFRVEKKIRETIELRRPSLVLIASDIAMNERTLRRNLKAMDTSFAAILETVKKDLCQAYLEEDRPYSEIAQLLWYSEQSAFTRAFKKWYGVSPKNR